MYLSFINGGLYHYLIFSTKGTLCHKGFLYLIIQNKDHLNKDGIEKIIKLKNTMNRLNDTTI